MIAHLGSGASLAAVRTAACVDTTMGLTPIGGLMMSTRSGDVDPGALVHLMRERGLDADGLERLVEDESGLLGVSGSTGDMRELLDARSHDARAALAVDLWCMTVRKHIGALAAVLGGIDSLVFTGGIGERSAELARRDLRGPRASRRRHRRACPCTSSPATRTASWLATPPRSSGRCPAPEHDGDGADRVTSHAAITSPGHLQVSESPPLRTVAVVNTPT